MKTYQVERTDGQRSFVSAKFYIIADGVLAFYGKHNKDDSLVEEYGRGDWVMYRERPL